ncbi:hypothetical protein [Enterovibrio coralii]|uniref:Uncharacterized protein n=1 Tax=Enterovibrio coralii TaxID=294935 RepID=A0A135IC62_9GAMM|nr:hypothetical protein [Enterovibrio coralii]KXF83052.1 hypothetical protein ATN88_04790 [Enterovibrio coralii]
MSLFDFPVITSFLAAFSLNLFISASAMAIGFPIGITLFKGVQSNTFILRIFAKAVRSLIGNIPSFVMLYYFAIVIPSNGHIFGYEYSFPPLFNAIFALALPVVGYSCDLSFQKQHEGRMVSFRALNQFFLIILMASTTASAIGVTEVLATANNFIASSGDATQMLSAYFVVALFFLCIGLLLNAVTLMVEKRFPQTIRDQNTLQGEHA